MARFIDACTAETGSGIAPLVDMGAYEFLPADIDSTGIVNLQDYSFIAAHWLETGCADCEGIDLNCDEIVDLDDLLILLENWMVGIQ